MRLALCVLFPALRGSCTGGALATAFACGSSGRFRRPSVSGKGHAGGRTIDAFGFKASMHRADMAACLEALRSMLAQKGGLTAQTQQLDKMMAPLLKRLVANPSFSVDELKLTIEGQTASLHYSLGTEGMNAQDIQGPARMPAQMQKGLSLMGATVPVGGRRPPAAPVGQ